MNKFALCTIAGAKGCALTYALLSRGVYEGNSLIDIQFFVASTIQNVQKKAPTEKKIYCHRLHVNGNAKSH